MKRLRSILALHALLSLLVVTSGCKPTAATTKAATTPLVSVTNAPTAIAALQEAVPIPRDPLCGLPDEVQETIRLQVGNGKLTRLTLIDEGTDDADRVFDGEMIKAGVTRGFSVAEDGTPVLLQVFESELPEAVRTIVYRQVEKGKLGEITRMIEEGETNYTAEIALEGRTNTLSVAENGGSWSLDIDLTQIPAAVQKTVHLIWGQLQPTAASRKGEESEVFYELVAEREGRRSSLSIAPDGRFIAREDELPLSMVPAPVQTAVKGKVGAGELLSLSKLSYAVAGVFYEATARRDGEVLEFSLDASGAVLVSGQ